MLLVVIIAGVILIVAAIRNTQQTLFGDLGQDVPAFVVWGAAILAVGVIGYIRPLKTASDALLVLIVTVLILNNYENLLKGFQQIAQPNAGVTPTASTSEGASAGTAAGNAAGNLAGSLINSATGSGAANSGATANAIINQVATSAGVNG